MQQKGLPRWKDKDTLDRVLLIVQLITAVGVLICTTLSLFDVTGFREAALVYQPLVAIMFLCMGLQYRKTSPKTMWLLLGVAVLTVVSIIKVYSCRL